MSLSITDGAMLGNLFRPAGPLARSVASFISVSMSRLTISEAQSGDGTVIESVDDKPLDWDRLRDAKDSYNSILFNSKRVIVLKDSEFKLGLPLAN